MNKNEYALKGTEYYELVQDRENVILLGDSLGDAGMADGMPHCNSVLKIGFLYDHVSSFAMFKSIKSKSKNGLTISNWYCFGLYVLHDKISVLKDI